MATMIHDRVLEQRLREERKASGADRYDEVWEGVYMMAPMPNHEHQILVTRWARVLDEIVTDHELGEVLAGVNVSDRVQGWEHNYRVPDVAVFLKTTKSINHSTFWFGGPDFAIEIVSRDDQSREKIGFYAAVGTRELLLVDRDPWRLELHRLSAGVLSLVAESGPTDPRPVVSEVLPLKVDWRNVSGCPRMHVEELGSGKEWTI